MDRKLAVAVVVLGLASLSPAPINRAKGPRSFHPEQSQEQIAQQQRFNGTVPIVGQIPRYLDQVGEQSGKPQPMERSNAAENSLTAGTERADKVGAITRASQRVESEATGNRFLWIWGLLIAAAGFGGWKFVQYRIEQITPVPEFSKRLLKEIESGKI